MKKLLSLGVTIAVLSGCNTQTSTPTVQTPEQTGSEYEEVANSLLAGKSVRCLMTNTSDGNTMSYAMKGEKVRLNNSSAAQTSASGEMIMDGEYVYTWSNDKKEGTKYKIPPATDQASPDGTQIESTTEFKPEDIQDYQNMGYIVDCKEENISDSEFTPPTDVTFTDLSAMMEGLNNSKTNPEMSEEQKAQFDKLLDH